MFVECPNEINIFITRLITQRACFIIVMCSGYHKSIRLHNIVMKCGAGTHHFVPFVYAGFNLASCSLGCTAVLGPEHGTRLRFLD